jgi:hypothetical protein
MFPAERSSGWLDVQQNSSINEYKKMLFRHILLELDIAIKVNAYHKYYKTMIKAFNRLYPSVVAWH